MNQVVLCMVPCKPILIVLQSKIRELEEKLREERHHRKLMQERAAEVCGLF